jgi:hypothetical protein
MSKALMLSLAIEMVILGALLTVAADQIAHTHVEKLGGVNIWGYRGSVLHQKQPNEVRLTVTGGDLAFGWGVAASETLAPSVRDLVRVRLDVPGRDSRLVTGVTTAARGLAPAGYASWIDHYAYLRPDVICLVPDPIGYVSGGPTFLPDRRSIVFTTFGYSPILPLVLQEKGTFAHSATLRLAGRLLDRTDALLGDRTHPAGAAVANLEDYTIAIDAAVRAGLRSATAGVVVVLAPASDHRAVTERLASTFVGERVRVVDLGADPRMLDAGLRLDGFNFSTGGHAVAAQSVAPAVRELVEKAGLGAH